jgi:hypothetical protein
MRQFAARGYHPVMRSTVWAVVAIFLLGARPARADDAAQALKQELANLANSYGVGEPPKGREPPRIAIDDRITIGPTSFDQIMGPWGHHGNGSSPVVGMTADGKVGWIAMELSFSSLCGMATCMHDPPVAEAHGTALFERGPQGWQPIAWDFARVLPGKEEAIAKQHPPAAIARSIAAGADDVVREVSAALATPAALAKLVSDRPDVVLYGSARKERFVGGAAARAKLLAWKLQLELRDGVLAGLTTDKAAAWLVANVDATGPGDKRATAYRLFAICEKTPAGWRVVQLSFSIPNEPAA